jgi:hypothetical protein
MPSMERAGSIESSPAAKGPSTAAGWLSTHRWGIVALAFIAVVTIAGLAVSLGPREREQTVAPVARTQPPTEVPPRSLPPPAPIPRAPVNRLKTGVNIWAPRGTSGLGSLRIHNGTSYDAAALLREEGTGTPRRFVYVRAHEMTTLGAIAPCHCRLFFALGTDWDAQEEEFRADARFSAFEDGFRFEESETDSGVEYATFSVTLHPVREGQARTTRLSKEEFEKRLGKRPGQRGGGAANGGGG